MPSCPGSLPHTAFFQRKPFFFSNLDLRSFWYPSIREVIFSEMKERKNAVPQPYHSLFRKNFRVFGFGEGGERTTTMQQHFDGFDALMYGAARQKELTVGKKLELTRKSCRAEELYSD